MIDSSFDGLSGRSCHIVVKSSDKEHQRKHVNRHSRKKPCRPELERDENGKHQYGNLQDCTDRSIHLVFGEMLIL